MFPPERGNSYQEQAPHDSSRRVPGNRRRVDRCLPPTAHLSACRPPGPGLADLPGAPLPVADHLDQRRSEPQLERGVFPALALPVGTAAVVPPDPETRLGLLPATAGRRGSGRYPVAQDGTLHSTGVLST